MPDGMPALPAVHRGERRQLGYLLTVFILISAGLALAKGTADALFFKRFGIDYLPVMFVLTGVSTAVLTGIYTAFSGSVSAERLFKISFIFMIILLLLSWVIMQAGTGDLIYPVYFLLYEISAVLFLLHGTRYLSQNLSQQQMKRLMPAILAGSQFGAILGGLLLAGMSRYIALPDMLLVWGVILLASLFSLNVWHSKKGPSPYFIAIPRQRCGQQNTVRRLVQGMRFLKKSRLLRASLWALFFMLITSSMLVYAVNRIYTETFATEQELAAFYGLLTAAVGSLLLIIQLFFSQSIIRWSGVKRIHLFYPFASIISFAGLMFSFTLPLAFFGSFTKDVLLPAFSKPARSLMLDTLPQRIQASAELLSDIIVAPLALVVAGLLLWAGLQADDFFLLPGLLAALAFLYFNHRMNIAYVRGILINLKQKLQVPEHQIAGVLDGREKEFLKEIEAGVLQKDEGIAIAYARVLSMAKPERAASLLPWRMQNASVAAKDQMIKMLQPLQSKKLREKLRNELGKGDVHLDATLYRALFESRDPDSRSKVENLLFCKTPRLRATGILGALIYPVPELFDQAHEEWLKLLNDSRPEFYIPGIELAVPEMAGFYLDEPIFGAMQQVLVQMLDQPNSRFKLSALKMIVNWPTDDFKAAQASVTALSQHDDWRIRREVVRASYFLPYDDREKIIGQAMEDQHTNVRKAAVKCQAERYSDESQWLVNALLEQRAQSPRATQAILDSLLERGGCADVLQPVSTNLAEKAVQMHRAASLLDAKEDSSQAAALLSIVLQERRQSFTDLSLSALQSSAYDSEIAVIRAGLTSRSKRQIRSACARLPGISNQQVACGLLAIYGDGEYVLNSQQEGFSSVNDVLKWITLGNDSWLKECVNHFNSTMRKKHHV